MESLKKKRNVLFVTLLLSIAIFTLLTLIIGNSKTLAIISITVLPVLSFFTIILHIVVNIEKYWQKMISYREDTDKSLEDTKEYRRIEMLTKIIFWIIWFLSWAIVVIISCFIGITSYTLISGESITI